MKIGLIIILGVCLFVYFSIKSKTPNPEAEEKARLSKEKYEELIKEEKKEEVLAVIDTTQGDIANIKLLREAYGLNLLDAKNLWEHIKPSVLESMDFSNVKEIVDYSQGDIANIKIIKDMSSGAVLVSAFISVIVGLLIFIPKILVIVGD